MLQLVRTSRISLTDQIVDGLVLLIERRQLAEGMRLPSVRQLARQLGVSAFTIVTAYDRLAARGVIEPRPGTGFFVARRGTEPALAGIEAPPETPDTALGLARAALDLAPIAVPRLVEEKLLSVLSAPALPEAVVAEALATGRFRRHIAQLRTRLAKARAPALKALTAAGLTVDGEQNGLFVWTRTPDGVDADRLVREARQEGILLAKGALFSPGGRHPQHFRFNAAHAGNPALGRFLQPRLRAA